MTPFTWMKDARPWIRNNADGPLCILIETDDPICLYRSEVYDVRKCLRLFLDYVHGKPRYDPIPRPSVYFLASSTHIKVGCSVNIKNRMASVANPISKLLRPRDGDTTNLRLIGTLPKCGYKAESSAKRMLRQYRDIGEWFFLSPEVLSIIQSMPKFQGVAQ